MYFGILTSSALDVLKSIDRTCRFTVFLWQGLEALWDLPWLGVCSPKKQPFSLITISHLQAQTCCFLAGSRTRVERNHGRSQRAKHFSKYTN